jgi:hypothetical protein
VKRAAASRAFLAATLALAGAATGGCRHERTDAGVPSDALPCGPDPACADAGSAADGGGGASDSGIVPPGVACAPLPPPAGTVVAVTPADADLLPAMVYGAAPGTTFLLADGTYTMTGASESERRIWVHTPGVTLRSASGNRDAVVVDGEYLTAEIFFIDASDVTLADLTVTRAVDHPIHVVGAPGNVTGVLLHDLHVVDGGEQQIKVNSDGMDDWADDGVLECSLVELTAAGRTFVAGTNPGQCYTGGIDAHGAWGWSVRDNTFRNVYCDNGYLAEHAVHFWNGARDTVVERNTILDCARGVGFGLVETGAMRTYSPDPYPGAGYIGHYDGVIRNNVLWAAGSWFDTGIELDQARGARVHHNTVVHPATAFSSIDYRFANTLVEIRDNIVVNVTMRDGAAGTVEFNLLTTATSLFADAAGLDFHLVPGAPGAGGAIDQGVAVTGAGLDIDGEAHDNGPPDIGADEVW